MPGQVYYNSTRKLVLQGVDGIIFVADSSASMINQNLESLRNLEENLNEYGKSLSTLPHVIQLNKRDLPDAMSVEELGRLMNPHNAPIFEAIANTGQGVFPTLKALAASVLKNIMNESGQKAAPYPPAAPAAPQARQAAPARPAAGAPPRQPAAFPQRPQPQAPMPSHGAQPNYPPIGMPQPTAGGTGFFPGQPGAQMGHQQPHAQMPAGGLQIGQPGSPHAPAHLSQTRSQPRPALHVAQPMPMAQPMAQPRPPQAPAPRPQQRAAPAPAKGRPAHHKTPAPEPKKARGKLTPVLLVAGAGVGAVLAWVLMNVL